MTAISSTTHAACAQDRPGAVPRPGGATPEESAAIALLFDEDAGGLSESDRVEIFAGLGVAVSEDGAALVDATCGQPVSRAVRFEDLDADGETEVIVDYGNACMSGMAGTSVMLFVRDADGRYRPHLGFPGMIAGVLPTPGGGYPELLIGGPGFCFAVWSWDGEAYVHVRDEPQAPGGCDGRQARP